MTRRSYASSTEPSSPPTGSPAPATDGTTPASNAATASTRRSSPTAPDDSSGSRRPYRVRRTTLTAASEHGIIDALTHAGMMTFADKGYQGAGGTVRTPFKPHHRRPPLSDNQKP
jgi:hypothetical protein